MAKTVSARWISRFKPYLPSGLWALGKRADWLVRRPTGALRALPDFLIIGTQKGGTTSLYHYVVRHPDVAPPYVKEVHYFGEQPHRPEAWYRAHFCLRARQSALGAMRGQRQLTGEASPSYLWHPLAPRRVHDLVPEARFIAVLRDPVSRAYSHYQHRVQRGAESAPFETLVDREMEALAGHEEERLTDEGYCLAHAYDSTFLGRGVYWVQVRQWLDTFPREQMLFMRSEDLYARTQELVEDTWSFLGLRPAPMPPLVAYLKRTYEPMRPDTKARLRAYYAPHNEKLAELLGATFNWSV